VTLYELLEGVTNKNDPVLIASIDDLRPSGFLPLSQLLSA
jgi:hypothetical protein